MYNVFIKYKNKFISLSQQYLSPYYVLYVLTDSVRYWMNVMNVFLNLISNILNKLLQGPSYFSIVNYLVL